MRRLALVLLAIAGLIITACGPKEQLYFPENGEFKIGVEEENGKTVVVVGGIRGREDVRVKPGYVELVDDVPLDKSEVLIIHPAILPPIGNISVVVHRRAKP